MGFASADAPTASREEPEPRAAEASVGVEPVDSAAIDAALLACDGPALLGHSAAHHHAQAKDASAPASARAWGMWEELRAFDDGGALAPPAVDAAVESLRAALQTSPPAWWVDQLRSARRNDAALPYYNVGLTETGDRRGGWTARPGGLRIRPENDAVLVVDGEHLAYDFSVGRAQLMKAPQTPGSVAEVTRAHAGSTAFIATFEPSSGGFPFEVRAVDSQGVERWAVTACGPNRTVLGGKGHLTVELIVLQDPAPRGTQMRPASPIRGLAVFSAESHGLAVEVFDATHGHKTFAWTSDLWFHRR